MPKWQSSRDTTLCRLKIRHTFLTESAYCIRYLCCGYTNKLIKKATDTKLQRIRAVNKKSNTG